jgi:hypothetical protein
MECEKQIVTWIVTFKTIRTKIHQKPKFPTNYYDIYIYIYIYRIWTAGEGDY